MIQPPFNKESALRLTQRTADAWNSYDPTELVLLLDENATWNENGNHFCGRAAILQELQSKRNQSLHFSLEQTLSTYTANNITVEFNSEWQNSRHGQWFQNSGTSSIAFSDTGKITAVKNTGRVRSITSSERMSHAVVSSVRKGARL